MDREDAPASELGHKARKVGLSTFLIPLEKM